MRFQNGHQQTKLTLIPSNLDNARRGLSALRVLRDLIGPRSEYPIQLATKLMSETCGQIKHFLFATTDAAWLKTYFEVGFRNKTYIYNEEV